MARELPETAALRSVARRGVTRDLVCPECAGPILLEDGLYWCASNRDCGQTSFASLQELRAVPAPGRRSA